MYGSLRVFFQLAFVEVRFTRCRLLAGSSPGQETYNVVVFRVKSITKKILRCDICLLKSNLIHSLFFLP